jgi:Tol biopolymer transport system component
VMPVVSRPQPGKPARLVYVRSSTDYNIWRVETSAVGAPTSSPPVVAIASTRTDLQPLFSPDGSRVVFGANRSESYEIWVSDPNGMNAVKLTSMGAPITGAPRWSPDGQMIAFGSNVEGQFEIYVIPAAGGKPRRVTSHPALDHAPSFSSDGKWIYFGSNRTGQYQVWKTPVAGGDAVQVTRDGGFASRESPDGAYLYYHTPAAPGGSIGLWRLPVSGGQAVKVLDNVDGANFAVLERGIYYIETKSGEARLHFYDLASRKSITIARNLGDVPSVGGLTASPDGRSILYSRLDSSIDDLMLVENFR